MDRDLLLEQLTALDFKAADLGLYLDTHPCDTEAVARYNSVIESAEAARGKYESLYGPLCSFRSGSDPREWAWIDCPWPWEQSANYSPRVGKGDFYNVDL